HESPIARIRRRPSSGTSGPRRPSAFVRLSVPLKLPTQLGMKEYPRRKSGRVHAAAEVKLKRGTWRKARIPASMRARNTAGERSASSAWPPQARRRSATPSDGDTRVTDGRAGDTAERLRELRMATQPLNLGRSGYRLLPCPRFRAHTTAKPVSSTRNGQ